MSKKEILIQEIEQVPESCLDEVLDFVHFLKSKIIREKIDTAIASESSLRREKSHHHRISCFADLMK